MLTIKPNTISEEVRIREMEAPELAEYAGRLDLKITEGSITDEELTWYRLAKANYKHITGHVLTEATMHKK